MERGALSNNNRDFIRNAIREEVRIDGRQPCDHRKISFEFSLDDATATVRLGGTRALAAVTAALEAPFGGRGREGALRFNVELSPMASLAFEAGRPGEDAVELARLVERALKQSGAVDMEALCVLPGRKVWSLRVDVHILDHCGNLVDAAVLAALAALAAFRKPQVSVGQADDGSPDQVTIHSPDVREPQPLSMHHLPFPITFALFEGGNLIAADPSLQEEAASDGSITLVLNPHGEVCAVQKADGAGMSRDQLMRCVRIAAGRAGELSAALKEALKAHDAARVAARVRRRAAAAAGGEGGAAKAAPGGTVAGADGRHVVALRDVGEADARLAALMKEMEAAAEAAAAAAASSSSSSEDSSSSSSDDSDSSSSDASSSGDEAAGAGAGGAAAAGAGGKQPKQKAVAKAAAPAAFVKPKKATLKSDDFARKAAISKRPLQAPSPKGNRASKPRFGDAGAAAPDNMAAIAAIIAGAGKGGGGGGGGEPPSLAAAIKPKGAKKKKAAAAGARAE